MMLTGGNKPTTKENRTMNNKYIIEDEEPRITELIEILTDLFGGDLGRVESALLDLASYESLKRLGESLGGEVSKLYNVSGEKANTLSEARAKVMQLQIDREAEQTDSLRQCFEEITGFGEGLEKAFEPFNIRKGEG